MNTTNTTRQLHELGQSIWLDNITRELLNNGALARYIAELSVTGLTSNPTIFEHAITTSTAYDASPAASASTRRPYATRRAAASSTSASASTATGTRGTSQSSACRTRRARSGRSTPTRT